MRERSREPDRREVSGREEAVKKKLRLDMAQTRGMLIVQRPMAVDAMGAVLKGKVGRRKDKGARGRQIASSVAGDKDSKR